MLSWDLLLVDRITRGADLFYGKELMGLLVSWWRIPLKHFVLERETYCDSLQNGTSSHVSQFISQDLVTSFQTVQSVDSFQRTLIANIIWEKPAHISDLPGRQIFTVNLVWWYVGQGFELSSSGTFAFFSVRGELLSNADGVQSQLLSRQRKEKTILVTDVATIWLWLLLILSHHQCVGLKWNLLMAQRT